MHNPTRRKTLRVAVQLAAFLAVPAALAASQPPAGSPLPPWKAQWIGTGPALEPRTPAGILTNSSQLTNLSPRIEFDGGSTLLRKAFTVDKPVRRATARVTGLGYFEFHCNGQRVSDLVLAPAKSNYRKWILYETFDLTGQIQPGTNVLGVMLGNGWFNPWPKWWNIYRMPWYGSKRALVQLDLEFADGSAQMLGTDGTWSAAPGPVKASCVFDGETYDATAERPGWDQQGFATTGWKPARVVEAPGGTLQPRAMPPIRVVEHLPPVAIAQPKPGVHVVDFGQNFAGWARVTASGSRGHRITLRYAEDLKPDGMIDPTSNEKAAATDVYIMKGGGRETYEPRFTFHGFRYLEVLGFPGTPRKEDFLGCVVHSDCPSIGEFESGNDLVNRIHRATRRSQRSNLMGYPMDCPQRDERLGWFGDALVTMEEAMFNFDMADFYRHWLGGVRLNQSEITGDISILSPRPYVPDEPDPTWSSAYVAMLWQFYVHYGDRRILEEHFDSMRRFVDYLGTQATNHILPKYWIGDWGTTVKGWTEGEPVSVVTAFYYWDALLLAKTAAVLGKTAEAEKYRALARSIRVAFNKAYYDAKTANYERGTQFANALPLYLGLVPGGDEQRVLQNILRDLERNGGRFNVGVLGAKYLIDALTLHGRADVAYGLVNQTGFPSWAHLLEGGRTTLSEFWDLRGSHNHVMLGSIDGWFFRALAGLAPDEANPGWAHFFVRPFIPPTLNHARASTQTVRGPVSSEWRKQGDTLVLKVNVPPNARATVFLPAGYTPLETQPPVEPRKSPDSTHAFEVTAGTFELRARVVR